MRVAFVSANRAALPDRVIPIGVLQVMAACRERHEAALIDLAFEDDPVAALDERLSELRPDVVAIGLRNLHDEAYGGAAENVRYYRELVDTARRCTGAPVVVGGGGFSVMPVELMRRLGADYGVEGEGEEPLRELLATLDRGGDVAAVGGLHRWNGETVRFTPRRSFVALDELPVPDRSLVDPRYLELSGTESIQTKRGCALECRHCTYPLVEGARVRTRSPARVAAEIAELGRRPGVEHLFIVDAVFNVPRRHAMEVCRTLEAHGAPLPWTCYLNPRGVDEELAGAMARAGAVGVEMGVDAGSDAVLDRLHKGFSTADVRRAQRHLRRAGVKDCMTFMLGTPGETLAEVEQTLAFAAELDPCAAIFMIWVDDAEAVAAASPERQDLRRRITALVAERARTEPRWVVPSLGLRFDRRLFAALRRRGLRGPLWQHLPTKRS